MPGQIEETLGRLVHNPDYPHWSLFETLIYIIYRDWIVKPNSIVIDIGAHKGLHTFRLADCVGPDGRVIAFEPLPELVDELRTELARRYGDKNPVEIRQAALSDTPGLTTFYRSEHASRSSLTPGPTSFVGQLESFEVPVQTLDTLLAEDIGKWVTFMKIDAEGAEYNILKGGLNFFKQRGPLTVIEFSAAQLQQVGATPEDFFDLLDQINYSFYNIDGSPFNLEHVKSGKNFPCYERFGARRGHWFENFIKERMPALVMRQLERNNLLDYM